MYGVSPTYKQKIQELNRTFKIRIVVGGVTLTDEDIQVGSFSFTEGTQSGNEFDFGGIVASTVNFKTVKNTKTNGISFMGSKLTVSVGLEINPILNTYEWVPLGIFNVDFAKNHRTGWDIKAMDNMIKFDKAFRFSNLKFPTTLGALYTEILAVAGVSGSGVGVRNPSFKLEERPNRATSLREILQWITQLNGTFARCNRNGAMELDWYKPSGLTVTSNNRFNFEASDYRLSITGITAKVGDIAYNVGSENYLVDISDNELLSPKYGMVVVSEPGDDEEVVEMQEIRDPSVEVLLSSILSNVNTISYIPFEATWQGNPAMVSGETITHIDMDGKRYDSIITNSEFKYRGKSIFSGKGVPDSARGFNSDTRKNKRNTQSNKDNITTIPTYPGGSNKVPRFHIGVSVPNSKLGNNGDIYVQIGSDSIV